MRVAGLTALALLAAGTAAWSYGANHVGLFRAGLLLVAASCVVLAFAASRRRWMRLVFLANTVGSLLLGLVVLDSGRALLSSAADDTAAAAYVFGRENNRAAEKVASGRAIVSRQFSNKDQLPPMLMPDPTGQNRYQLRPGVHHLFGGSVVRVNSRGFRGREIESGASPRYRIVALGESTTFGVLRGADDKPWPELLEDIVRKELRCKRSVEIVNAGVPGWDLGSQLLRLQRDVLPLEPDLILTYHGHNSFRGIVRQLPEVVVDRVPVAPPRPSQSLQSAENVLRMWWFRRRFDAARRVEASVLQMDVTKTDLYRQYGALRRQTLALGIKLAMSNFSMAVNADSPEEVLQFYEDLHPDVRIRILANRLHTRLLGELAQPPSVIAIDTSAELDGNYAGGFVDLIHFDPRGRQRLAWNMFEALRETLEAELGCASPESSSEDVWP